MAAAAIVDGMWPVKFKLPLDYEPGQARYPALRKSVQIEDGPVINLPLSLL